MKIVRERFLIASFTVTSDSVYTCPAVCCTDLVHFVGFFFISTIVLFLKVSEREKKDQRHRVREREREFVSEICSHLSVITLVYSQSIALTLCVFYFYFEFFLMTFVPV